MGLGIRRLVLATTAHATLFAGAPLGVRHLGEITSPITASTNMDDLKEMKKADLRKAA